MTPPGIATTDAAGRTVWRIGRFPDPWAWTDHAYSGGNRWDDPEGAFRTLYVADTLLACFLEVLAFARPDTQTGIPILEAAGITEDPEDADAYPTPAAGGVPHTWLGTRLAATGRLDGTYADVRAPETIAALRPLFLPLAEQLGLPDFDAAAIKLARPRTLTHAVARTLYTWTLPDRTTLDGIRFASRHGDTLALWAVYERDTDTDRSRHITPDTSAPINEGDPDLQTAFTIHRLHWTS